MSRLIQPPSSSRLLPLWPTLLIFAIGLFLLIGLRSGQDWDGDFALYLMNAQNILQRLPYAVTPYVLNPANAINPAAYPPGLPLLFAPVVYFLGPNLQALKVECTLALIAFLAVYWRLVLRKVGYVAALVCVAAIGVHPFMVLTTQSVMSELPFLLFCYAALLAFDRLDRTLDPPSPGTAPILTTRTDLIATIILAATMTAMADLTRSVAILLFPAAFISSVWRGRRLLTPSNAALALAAGICFLVQLAYRGDVGTYVHYFDQFDPHVILTNCSLYWHYAQSLLGESRPAIWFCRLLLLVALVGLVVRRRISVLEWFFAAYVALLIVYPVSYEPARYEMPIWPLIFLYGARGVSLLTRSLSERRRQVVVGVLIAAIFALYARDLASMPTGPIRYSVGDPRSEALFAAIRGLPPQARILTRKPTVLALYTGHESMIWPEQFTDQELETFIRTSHLDYLVQDHPHMGVPKHAIDLLDPFLARNPALVQPVFVNEWFTLYKIAP